MVLGFCTTARFGTCAVLASRARGAPHARTLERPSRGLGSGARDDVRCRPLSRRESEGVAPLATRGRARLDRGPAPRDRAATCALFRCAPRARAQRRRTAHGLGRLDGGNRRTHRQAQLRGLGRSGDRQGRVWWRAPAELRNVVRLLSAKSGGEREGDFCCDLIRQRLDQALGSRIRYWRRLLPDGEALVRQSGRRIRHRR